jgi:peptidoglycan/LPS O-acetylase OafA/YrhL
VSRYGYLGVDLFFVISGFVVQLSAWDRRPPEFVVSRIVRLYPAFWIAVTVVVVIPASMPTAGITAVSSRFHAHRQGHETSGTVVVHHVGVGRPQRTRQRCDRQ